MEREVVLTEEGYNKLKVEIEHLQTVKVREVAERIKEAREFGDISENSEYDDAKNEQAQVAARIIMLEQQLRNARVVAPENVSTESVSIGARVTVKDLATKKNNEYAVVGSAETVRKGIAAFVDREGPDEIMATAMIFDHAARLRSFELLAEIAVGSLSR